MNGEEIFIVVVLFIVVVVCVGLGVFLMSQGKDDVIFPVGVISLVAGILAIPGPIIIISGEGINLDGVSVGSTTDEVIYKEVGEDLDITDVVIKEGGKDVEEGEVKVEYRMKDDKGFIHEREGVVYEHDMEQGEGYKIVEEFDKDSKERTGRIEEIIIKEEEE